MKKIYIYVFFGIILLVISACLGFYIFKISQFNNPQEQEIEEIAVKEIKEESIENIEQQEVENEIITTSGEEKKVSPNAALILKKYFKGCKHTTKSYVEIPKELVNLTEKEVNEFYNDWTVVSFAPNEIVLQKEVEGNCNEHYALRERDGYVAIYSIDERGIETLKEMTQISTQFLPESDIEKLKEGIKVYGKENLNAAIEEYE